MLSVKGLFKDGVAQPEKPIEGRDGQNVIIIFLEEDNRKSTDSDEELAWDKLIQLVQDCGVETGLTDLAHQHDHHLYDKPKVE